MLWLCVFRKNLTIQNLDSFLDNKMEECASDCKAFTAAQSADPTVIGRLGPSEIVLDSTSNVGTIIIEPDRLGVSVY
jgi:hypothetical protein